jgi:hypothetical protein
MPVSKSAARGAGVEAPLVAFVEPGRLPVVCRSITTLYNLDPPATRDEVQAAARQYVRKVSGFTRPSRANEEAFARAVAQVAAASEELLAKLSTPAPPRDREALRARARQRAERRGTAAA